MAEMRSQSAHITETLATFQAGIENDRIDGDPILEAIVPSIGEPVSIGGTLYR